MGSCIPGACQRLFFQEFKNLCVCAFVWVDACEGQRRALDPFPLELQDAAESLDMGAGNRTLFLSSPQLQPHLQQIPQVKLPLEAPPKNQVPKETLLSKAWGEAGEVLRVIRAAAGGQRA